MAARARSTAEHGGAAPAPYKGAPKAKVQVANEDSVAAPSPALMLQNALSAELAEPEVKKWPPAATLAFVVVTCGVFWTLVGLGVRAALR